MDEALLDELADPLVREVHCAGQPGPDWDRGFDHDE